MLLHHVRHALDRRRLLVDTVTRVQQRRRLNSAPSKGPFDIFFLGSDEFSVVVLEQLLQHRGTSFLCPLRFLLDCLCLVDHLDVWRSLEIATHPTVKGGRNGTNDIVGMLPALVLQCFGVNEYML